ncbi:MAG: thiol:disulfide interchange protein, partial [Kiritimatiellales bacterium]|nr:thiol:disulfide interchange protein [Kiritimatiellales bacterium]
MAVAYSASADSLRSKHVEAEWVPESAAIQPGEPFRLGLRLTHAPGWHTYWKNPGDFGMATEIDWSLPDGMTAEPIEYAVPHRIKSQGLVTFGYENTTMHLVTLHPPATLRPGSTVRLGGELSWLECDEECIPGGGNLFIEIPVAALVGAVNPSLEREHVRPVQPSWEAVSRIEGNDLVIELQSIANNTPRPELEYFFPEVEGLVDLSVPMELLSTAEGYHLRMRLSPGHPPLPARLNGILVAKSSWIADGENRAARVSASIAPAEASGTVSPEGPPSVAYALLAAFLGGIILNLMPCVFPVISLKILGFVNLAGEDSAKVWRHGVLFAAGVVVSFWGVAGVLLAVKALVPATGWGFQLKEPIVVIAMSMLFMLLAMNMFGVFEMGTSLMGVGGNLKGRSEGINTFLSGVLATLVATPCTGPFMGVAVGVALTQPAAVAMLIFTALGVGMATPYLLLSRFPGWLRVVPRPGPWMESLKQFLGFLLMAFAMWLVWVLTGLRGKDGLGRMLTGMLLVGVAAWIYGRWGNLTRMLRVRIVAKVLAAGLLVGGVSLALSKTPESSWQAYSAELVDELKASGKPFFVDFTADWCVTCQA